MRFSAINLIASITGASGPIAWTSGVFDSSNCRTVRMSASSMLSFPFEGKAGMGMGLRRGYPRARLPGVNEVERTLFRLVVQPSEVFADHAERDQLHAAEEQDHCHHRRPARDCVAPQQRL